MDIFGVFYGSGQKGRNERIARKLLDSGYYDPQDVYDNLDDEDKLQSMLDDITF